MNDVTPIDRMRDQALAQKFYPSLVMLANNFNRQNPNAAHAVMAATMHFCVAAAKAIGMKGPDFMGLARQVWTDAK